MKIVIAGRVLASNVERFVSQAFLELGHETVIFEAARQSKGIYSQQVARALISLGPVRRIYEPYYDESINEKARSFFERERPDLVVCHNAGELNAKTVQY